MAPVGINGDRGCLYALLASASHFDIPSESCGVSWTGAGCIRAAPVGRFCVRPRTGSVSHLSLLGSLSFACASFSRLFPSVATSFRRCAISFVDGGLQSDCVVDHALRASELGCRFLCGQGAISAPWLAGYVVLGVRRNERVVDRLMESVGDLSHSNVRTESH